VTDLTRAIELLDALTKPGHDPAQPAQPLEAVVLRRMHDAQRGHPGSSMGGGGKGGGGSPIEAMLAGRDDEQSSAVFAQPDIGGDALTAWRKAVAQLDQAARTLDRLAMEWAPRQPSAKALRDTERVNSRQCENCRNADVRSDEPTDFAGRLSEPLRLCSDCYSFVRRHGRCSTPDDRERIARGKRVRDRVDATR
jgi:hypothetical protein